MPTSGLPRGCGTKLRNAMQGPCTPLSAPHLVTPPPPPPNPAASPLSDTAVSLGACSTLHLNLLKSNSDLRGSGGEDWEEGDAWWGGGGE